MFGIFGHSKLNLLLIDSDEVLHLRWQSGELHQIEQYSGAAADFDRFHVFLENDRKTPFAIIADVIEEDFRTESVAHVTGGDRKALVTRKLQLLFRSTPFRTASVIGRETKGRKDDRILFAALTKPEMYESWLKKILAKKIPVIAVTSAAFIMEQFAQSHALRSTAHLLVVNHEVNSGLRQSYIQKGRVIFGRLTPAGVSRSENFAELLLEQCTQTRNYLERIKELPYDAPLEVCVYTSEAFTEERESTHELLHFHYYSIQALPLTKKISIENGQPGAIAYSLIRGLKRKRSITNVYGPSSTLRYLQINRIRKLLFSISVVVLLGAGNMAGPTLSGIASMWEQEEVLNEQITPLNQEYRQLTERFPETPIQSAQMAIVVENHDRILNQIVRPNEVLALVSDGLMASPDLSLRSLSWDFDVVERTEQEIAAGSFPAGFDSQSAEYAFVEGRAQLVITVSGMVKSESSYREATAQVMTFVDTIKSRGGYEVTPVQLPINVGSNINVSTTVDGSEASGEFIVEVRKELSR